MRVALQEKKLTARSAILENLERSSSLVALSTQLLDRSDPMRISCLCVAFHILIQKNKKTIKYVPTYARDILSTSESL